MLSLALRSALLTLVTCAVTVSAVPGLTLKLSGAHTVDGIHNLKITATVVNTGDEALKLLNDPRGLLSKMPTQTFLVTHDESGAAPAFTGARVKYVPFYAAQFGSANAFTMLAPGQSLDVEHDLSKAYDFTSPGAGKYSFTANNQFYYVNDAGAPVAIYADQPLAHVAFLSGKLASPRPALAKRETYAGCSDAQQSQIVEAAVAAQDYAAGTYAYTQAQSSASERYTTWFGAYDAERHGTIEKHFSNLNNNTFADYAYDCSTCTEDETFAYVFPEWFGHVFLCGGFWHAPTTGTDSKGGILIHESTHFTRNGGTEDLTYGQTQAQDLAKSSPEFAVRNADSHEYYAENNPSLL